MKSFLILLAIFGSAFAVCPEYTAFANLNLQAYTSGQWHVQGLVRNMGGDPDINCVDLEFTSDDLTTPPVQIMGMLHGHYNNENNTSYMDHIDASVVDLTKSGQWSITINETAYKHTILHTDYQQYALSLSCTEIDGTNVYMGLVQSREHDSIPENILNSYKSLLSANEVNVSEFYYEIKHDLENCHDH